MSIRTFKHESADAILNIDESMGHARISNVYSRVHRKGHATGLMSDITAYADENQLDLWLEAKQYGSTTGLNNKQLVEFYKKFGFDRTEERTLVMFRRYIPVTNVTGVTNVTDEVPSHNLQTL